MALTKKQLRQVIRWMEHHHRAYADAIMLAEACGEDLQLYEDVHEWVIDAAVFALALDYFVEESA